MIVSDTNKKASADQVGDNWAGYLLNQAALQIRTMTALALSPIGLTPPQLRALETIAKEKALSQMRLGELVNMDRSTIVHVIDHFEALGAASRQPDPNDRRSHSLTLSPKGERLLADASRRARDVEDRFLSPLSYAERATLRTLLRQLFEPFPCPEEKKHEPSTPPSHPR